jgi:dTDP-4-dehydrorhamnose reductase
MMRILVIGKNSQLGQSINKLINENKYDDEFVFVGRGELDLSKEESIASYFDNNNFDVIVNCAAYTQVDKAEEEMNLADQVNHLAVKKLVGVAKEQQAKLIHISTDYVFDGESDKPYKETDATNPINIYGETKLKGEQVVQEIMPINAIIIRTSWLYSEYGNNFVDTMLRLGKERDELNVVNDQIGSPTYATNLADVILEIIQNTGFKEVDQATQIYHYSNKGEISWYEFAREVFKVAEIECKVKPMSTEQYPALANRPKNTVMNMDKIISNLNVSIFSWHDSLRACLYRLIKND